MRKRTAIHTGVKVNRNVVERRSTTSEISTIEFRYLQFEPERSGTAFRNLKFEEERSGTVFRSLLNHILQINIQFFRTMLQKYIQKFKRWNSLIAAAVEKSVGSLKATI